MGQFETETLALPENQEALADLNGQWIDRFHDRNGLKYIVLDMDSSVSPTHGDQEGAAWNGHSTAPVITRTSCSISSACWNAVLCAMAMSTALTAGEMFSILSSPATLVATLGAASSGRMPPMRSLMANGMHHGA